MEQVRKGAATASRTRSIALVGLSIALMAVSAWVSVPFGPVPFTLQTFMLVFVVMTLSPKQSIAAVAGYLLLGAIGVPVFSSMRGGIGILMGPTGGFLWGYLIGAVAAVAVHFVLAGKLQRAEPILKGLVFLVATYVCGWAQLMVVTHVSPAAAFAAGVAPFLLIEVVKFAAAYVCARAVKRVL